MAKETFHHRSGLKQQNKPFKGKISAPAAKGGKAAPAAAAGCRRVSALGPTKTQRKAATRNAIRASKEALQLQQRLASAIRPRIVKIVAFAPCMEDLPTSSGDAAYGLVDGTRGVQAVAECMAADVVVLVAASEDCVARGQPLVSLMKSVGMPTHVLLVPEALRGRAVAALFAEEPQVATAHDWPALEKLLAALSKTTHPKWRQTRPYLVGTPRVVEERAGSVALEVSGVIRGDTGCVGWKRSQQCHIAGIGSVTCHLAEPEPSDEPVLPSVYEPLGEEAEEQEEEQQRRTVRVKVVPEGTSEYQSAWMSSSEDGFEDEVEDVQMDAEDDDASVDSGGLDERIVRLVPDAVPTPPASTTVRQAYREFRGIAAANKASITSEQLDAIFPPPPRHLSHIVQLADVRASRRAALAERGACAVGDTITVRLTLPRAQCAELLRDGQVTLWALLRHEHQPAMLTFHLTQIREEEARPDYVALIDGFRLVRCSPVFSEVSLHAFARECTTLPVECMATLYGPLAYPGASVHLFGPDMQLAAMGVLASLGPRSILHRISLVGRPHRIHTKTTTVSGLFAHPSDVNYFRPIPLSTVCRNPQTRSRQLHAGYIQEPLGLHGKCKVKFERQCGSDDLICLHLWKRVWPSWSTRLCRLPR